MSKSATTMLSWNTFSHDELKAAGTANYYTLRAVVNLLDIIYNAWLTEYSPVLPSCSPVPTCRSRCALRTWMRSSIGDTTSRLNCTSFFIMPAASRRSSRSFSAWNRYDRK